MNNIEAFEVMRRDKLEELLDEYFDLAVEKGRNFERNGLRSNQVRKEILSLFDLASQEPTLKNNEFIPDSTEGRIQAAIKCLNMHWVSHDANRFDYAIEGLEKCLAGLASQAKRIEELEAATEHLGLTPKQAADGLTRYKAQVTEIESLRKQVESVKYFLLTCSSPDCVFTANTLRDQANTLLDQISASKNGE